MEFAIAYGSPFANPGAALSYYSNTNYVLLGLIIEEATGSPLAAAIRSRILTPLALENTYSWEEGVPDDHVSGYGSSFGGPPTDVSDLGLSWVWAAGGLVSSVEDTATFTNALFSGELYQQPESLDEMLTFVGRFNRPGQYGLGVLRGDFIPSEPVPLVMDGGAPGFVSIGAHWPNTGETAVVLLNSDNEDLKFAILIEAIQVAGLGR